MYGSSVGSSERKVAWMPERNTLLPTFAGVAVASWIAYFLGVASLDLAVGMSSGFVMTCADIAGEAAYRAWLRRRDA